MSLIFTLLLIYPVIRFGSANQKIVKVVLDSLSNKHALYLALMPRQQEAFSAFRLSPSRCRYHLRAARLHHSCTGVPTPGRASLPYLFQSILVFGMLISSIIAEYDLLLPVPHYLFFQMLFFSAPATLDKTARRHKPFFH